MLQHAVSQNIDKSTCVSFCKILCLPASPTGNGWTQYQCVADFSACHQEQHHQASGKIQDNKEKMFFFFVNHDGPIVGP